MTTAYAMAVIVPNYGCHHELRMYVAIITESHDNRRINFTETSTENMIILTAKLNVTIIVLSSLSYIYQLKGFIHQNLY